MRIWLKRVKRLLSTVAEEPETKVVEGALSAI
jgi:hypothetical protein